MDVTCKHISFVIESKLQKSPTQRISNNKETTENTEKPNKAES